MRVDIERVRELKEELRKINRLEFSQIEWYENGQPAVINPELLEEWPFIGLNNTCLVDLLDEKIGVTTLSMSGPLMGAQPPVQSDETVSHPLGCSRCGANYWNGMACGSGHKDCVHFPAVDKDSP